MLAANIDYINDSITDCQATIVQLEETKVPSRAEAAGTWGWVAVAALGDEASLPPVLGGAGLHRHVGGHQLLLPGRSPPPAGQLSQGVHRQGGPVLTCRAGPRAQAPL